MKTIMLFFSFVMFSGCTEQTVIQWQPWQYTLKSVMDESGIPANITVMFTGPGGITFESQGFTDDNKTCNFRASFPEAGKWKWETLSDNKDLNKRRGKVIVNSYSGDNPLYLHGDLTVSRNKRFLIHADSTPFIWMGETGWCATIQSTPEEWRDYVDIRSSQHFTVIQISPRGVSKNPAVDHARISFRDDGTPDPLFWNDLDEKIRYANSKGLFIMIVGAGKEWRDHFASNKRNQSFESYITGRMASYMVIFSPSFDNLYTSGNDSVAAEISKFTTHLVTQHPGTNYAANMKFRNPSWIDFSGMQSGHHGGQLERAYNASRAWTSDLWNADPVKPVINIEGMYDARGNNNGGNWRGKDVRKIGWISWMSGSMGYTYGAGDVPPKVPEGAGGVWKFNRDTSAYDYWRRAVLWPSAYQMTFMHDFFSTIKWWELSPSHGLIMNQAENDTIKMTVSKTNKGDLLLAYLPDNHLIEIDMRSMNHPLKAKWFNPVTGNYLPVDDPVLITERVPFFRPEGWEDALLILSSPDR